MRKANYKDANRRQVFDWLPDKMMTLVVFAYERYDGEKRKQFWIQRESWKIIGDLVDSLRTRWVYRPVRSN